MEEREHPRRDPHRCHRAIHWYRMPSVRFVIGLSLVAKNVPYPPEDMGYPLRKFLAERYYFLTSRTIDSQLLLRPDPEVNEILGEWLVRAQQLTGIELVV